MLSESFLRRDKSDCTFAARNLLPACSSGCNQDISRLCQGLDFIVSRPFSVQYSEFGLRYSTHFRNCIRRRQSSTLTVISSRKKGSKSAHYINVCRLPFEHSSRPKVNVKICRALILSSSQRHFEDHGYS